MPGVDVGICRLTSITHGHLSLIKTMLTLYCLAICIRMHPHAKLHMFLQMHPFQLGQADGIADPSAHIASPTGRNVAVGRSGSTLVEVSE